MTTRVNLALMGPPGSGKGSYGKLLAMFLPAAFDTASDILLQTRAHAIKSAHGALLDDLVVSDTLLRYLSRTSNFNKFNYHIIDGFPRTLRQVQLMEEQWPKRLQIHAAINLSVPRKVCRLKLLGRRLCRSCGGNFNIQDVHDDGFVLPPTLPKGDCCENPDWVEREDDCPFIVDKRLDINERNAMPVLEHYKSRNALFEFVPYLGFDDMPRFESELLEWLEIFQKRLTTQE